MNAKLDSFGRMMARINRKQVPLCQTCHLRFTREPTTECQSDTLNTSPEAGLLSDLNPKSNVNPILCSFLLARPTTCAGKNDQLTHQMAN